MEQTRAVAKGALRLERSCSIELTALVHSVLRPYWQREQLGQQVTWKDKDHLLRTAVLAVRHKLIDYARQRQRRPDGGAVQFDPSRHGFQDPVRTSSENPEEIIVLEAALKNLRESKPTWAEAIEMRYFLGLTFKEIGRALDLNKDAARTRCRRAAAWLRDAIRRKVEEEGSR
jgi:RNA polymerase sigma factor (sigma-70 family)